MFRLHYATNLWKGVRMLSRYAYLGCSCIVAFNPMHIFALFEPHPYVSSYADENKLAQ